MRNCLLLASSIVIALLLTSCASRHTVVKSDIQGTWVPSKDSLRWLKARDRSSCQMVFYVGERFQGVTPFTCPDLSDHVPKLEAAKGKWWLGKEEGETVVELDLPKYGPDRTEAVESLRTQWNDGRVELWFSPGDPDGDRFVFERVSRQTPKR